MDKIVNPFHISKYEDYKKLYEESIQRPEIFSTKLSNLFHWNVQPVDHKFDYNFNPTYGKTYIDYLSGAQTNICYNVLDRVIDNGFGSVTAYHWSALHCLTHD